jgi:hypothetical protein
MKENMKQDRPEYLSNARTISPKLWSGKKMSGYRRRLFRLELLRRLKFNLADTSANRKGLV